jgi:hypothetical protein
MRAFKHFSPDRRGFILIEIAAEGEGRGEKGSLERFL